MVLGRDDLLRSWSQIPVVPISTQIRRLSFEVRLTEADGLPSACVLKPEWIKAVERVHIGPILATLPASRWHEVEQALLDALGFGPAPVTS